jgi:hypothetical protein
MHVDVYPNGQVMVICMHKEQSELLNEIKYIEIDSSFKRINTTINGYSIKEFEICSFVERYQKSKIIYLM